MTSRNRTLGLGLLLILQILCAVFFIMDGLNDWLGLPTALGFRRIESFEMLLALVLLASVAATILKLRSMIRRQSKTQQQLAVARGQFSQIIQHSFQNWGLTDAEQDIALLTLKGFSVAEIAALKDRAEGTVKAHSAAIYRKAGVAGRMQLLSYFVDELLEGQENE